MSRQLLNTPSVSIPVAQVREMIELLTTLADGRENAMHQAQARVLANALGNRLCDVEKAASQVVQKLTL